MTKWFYPGHGEKAKEGCHRAMGGLAAAFFAYNAGAWILRRERHLAINAALYGALTVLELAQVKKHQERGTP